MKHSFSEDEYRLDFMKKSGFYRKKCTKCGRFFWTLNPFKEDCGESPCSPYTFIGKRVGRSIDELSQVRNSFLGFFKDRGHEVISPYPVVCRWRNDLYLTDASIVDFQPYVTEGIIPPPANPLVISQPCIRLVDVDMVGKTIGRHLTIFEMGGHHAFNSEGNEVYWKEDTVRYGFEFFTKEMGLKDEDLSFIESSWSGGGNAGPCFEVIAHGLEVATLVFMRYKVHHDGSLTELPIRTVDTGYGMERITWLLTGAPTGFHAFYRGLLERASRLVDIDFPPELLKEYAISVSVSGNKFLKPEEKLILVKRLGFPDDFSNKLETMENIFKALDHLKSLVFILSEGVVPSNTGVGYLARLLLRKTARVMDRLNMERLLLELASWEIEYWGKDFPSLLSLKDSILNLIEIELKKYRRSVEEGIKQVESILKENKSISTEKLIELYDSHGITPEQVLDLSSKRGVEIKIPEDFYSMIALRHRQPKNLEEETVNLDFDEKIFPETTKKYYEDPNLLEAEAKVLGVFNNKIILDKTIFYPEGGGQPSDTGKIFFNGREALVKDVKIVNNRVIHFVEGPVPSEGSIVKIIVDAERRLQLRRAHTATHIINAAARIVLGNHVWQAGAQKDVVESRLDITHPLPLTDEEIEKIERKANEIALANLDVEIKILPRTIAEREYGFRIYQGGAVPGKELRIVKIKGFDAEACGGLHVNKTGDIGLLKIVKVDRIQDGVERIIFRTGFSSVEYARSLENELSRLEKILGVPRNKIPDEVERIKNELKNLNKKVEKLMEGQLDVLANQLISQASVEAGVKIAFYGSDDLSIDHLITLGEKASKKEPNSIILLATSTPTTQFTLFAGELVIKKGVDCALLAQKIVRSIGVGGGAGGKRNFAKGGLAAKIDFETFRTKAMPILVEAIRG
ncbi:MAG: alanine--tRNA ligase [Crenarchaeota archaeon]|nr:alanine--tRNA ligase [Thermoproteota archaeon]MDW8033626.1 alanine--tRNA ligase [Nitrososphaerota archaeon]